MSAVIPLPRLQEVAELNPSLDAVLADDDVVSFLPMSAVDAENVDAVDSKTRRFEEVRKGYTPFMRGDVLVAKITPCFENGKIAQAKPKRGIGFGSTEFHVIRPHRSKLDARYLVHFLRQERIRKKGERKMTGSAGQRRVPEHFLANLPIPLPPLPEQRRIAEILDKADALRAKRRAARAQLDALTQSIFLDMFGDPATNPKGFPRTRLGALIREGDSICYGVVQPGDDCEDGVPLIRVSDLKNGIVNQSGLKRISSSIESAYRRSRLRGDEILVSCVGSTGVIALSDESVKGFNIARAVARVPLADSVSRAFMASYLRTEFVQRYFRNELRTVSQPTLNIKQISETPVVLPPSELQREFQRRMEAVARVDGYHREALQELDAIFASIQHQAFLGEMPSVEYSRSTA